MKHTGIHTRLFSTLAETVAGSTARSAAELAQSMLDNQTVIEQWAINIDALASEGLTGLIRQLKEAGPDRLNRCRHLLMHRIRNCKANEVYRSGAEVATQSFATELGVESFLSSGTNAISKIAERVNANDSFEVRLLGRLLMRFRQCRASQLTRLALSG